MTTSNPVLANAVASEKIGFGNPVLANSVAKLEADLRAFEEYCSEKFDSIGRLIYKYEGSSLLHRESADRKRIVSDLVEAILGTAIGLTPREEFFKRQILRTIVWLERIASHDPKLKTQCDDLLTRVKQAAAFLRDKRELAKKALAPPMSFADWWLGYSQATLDRIVAEYTDPLTVYEATTEELLNRSSR